MSTKPADAMTRHADVLHKIEQYIGTKWRHRKSGTVYCIVGHGIIEKGEVPCFFYGAAGQSDPILWVRPCEEFLDGRFDRVRPKE